MQGLIEAPLTQTRTSTGRGRLFEDQYREAFPGFARWVKHHGGTLDDSRDAFQDALVIYYEKAGPEALSPAAYVAGIAKHMFLRNFRNGITYADLTEAEKSIVLPADFPEDSATRSLLNLLERAGKKCLNLLTAFYYDKLPLKTLTRNFGFRTEHSATVQKFKCLEKLRNVVKVKALNYDDFQH